MEDIVGDIKRRSYNTERLLRCEDAGKALQSNHEDSVRSVDSRLRVPGLETWDVRGRARYSGGESLHRQ